VEYVLDELAGYAALRNDVAEWFDTIKFQLGYFADTFT
jgi:hypothetical protein